MALLTVLRQLHHVVENRAVSIKGTHPGKHHAAAVRGIQRGHKVLRRMRELAEKKKREKEKPHKKLIYSLPSQKLTGG